MLFNHLFVYLYKRTYMYIVYSCHYTYIHVHMYIYIYIHRERERLIYNKFCIYIYI